MCKRLTYLLSSDVIFPQERDILSKRNVSRELDGFSDRETSEMCNFPSMKLYFHFVALKEKSRTHTQLLPLLQQLLHFYLEKQVTLDTRCVAKLVEMKVSRPPIVRPYIHAMFV